MILRGATAVAAVAVLAAWPGQAAAKGFVTAVRVCGPSACVTITDRAVGTAIGHALEQGSGASPRLASFVRLTTRPAMFDIRGYLIPGQGIVVMNGSSHRLGPRTAGLIRSRLGAIAPYRPRMTRVWIGGHAVAHPRAYAALLRRPGVAMPASVWDHRMVPIAMTLAGQTPWDGWGSALYFPQLRLLHVPDGAWVRVTAAQADMIAADRRSSRSAAGGGGAPTIAIAAATAVVVLVAAMAALRHRPGRRAQAA